MLCQTSLSSFSPRGGLFLSAFHSQNPNQPISHRSGGNSYSNLPANWDAVIFLVPGWFSWVTNLPQSILVLPLVSSTESTQVGNSASWYLSGGFIHSYLF